MQQWRKLTRKRRRLLVIGGVVLVLLIGVLVAWTTFTHDRAQLATFTKQNPVTIDDQGAIDTKQALRVPLNKGGNGDWIDFDVSWYPKENSDITFYSEEPDDDMNDLRFLANLANRTVTFVYHYNDGNDDYEYLWQYGVSANGQALTAPKVTLATNGEADVRAYAKERAKQYEAAYRRGFDWLLRDRMSWSTLTGYVKAMNKRTTAITAAKTSARRAKAKARSKAASESSARQYDPLYTGYRPHYSDDAWRGYIRQRAKQLNLTVTKIEIRPFKAKTALHPAEIDDFTIGLLHQGTTGGTGKSTGGDLTYYFVTAGGHDYLVLLPTILINQTELNDTTSGDTADSLRFCDYLGNMAYPGTVKRNDVVVNDVVPKTRKPTTKEIVGNIMIIAPNAQQPAD